MLDVDKEFYEKVAEGQDRTLSEVLRDALTAYRALMQLPLVVSVRPLPELRGELLHAYEAGAVKSPNGPRPTGKRPGRKGPAAGK